MKKIFLIPLLLFLLACSEEKSELELEPPVFYEKGSSVRRLQKVLFPIENSNDTDKTMKLIGYLKEMEYRHSSGKMIRYYKVLDSHYRNKGQISNNGEVSRYEINKYTKKPESIDLGFHVLNAGIAALLGLKGENQYLLILRDLRREDTYVYQESMRKKRKREEERLKEIEAAKKPAE